MTAVRITDSAAVLALWWIAVGLAVLVIVPLALLLLHKTLRASLHIRRFTEESLAAAVGILDNVQAVSALDTTVEGAGPLVALGGRLEAKARTMADVLTARRGR